jgi:hypothetical protein
MHYCFPDNGVFSYAVEHARISLDDKGTTRMQLIARGTLTLTRGEGFRESEKSERSFAIRVVSKIDYLLAVEGVVPVDPNKASAQWECYLPPKGPAWVVKEELPFHAVDFGPLRSGHYYLSESLPIMFPVLPRNWGTGMPPIGGTIDIFSIVQPFTLKGILDFSRPELGPGPGRTGPSAAATTRLHDFEITFDNGSVSRGRQSFVSARHPLDGRTFSSFRTVTTVRRIAP